MKKLIFNWLFKENVELMLRIQREKVAARCCRFASTVEDESKWFNLLNETELINIDEYLK